MVTLELSEIELNVLKKSLDELSMHNLDLEWQDEEQEALKILTKKIFMMHHLQWQNNINKSK